LLCLRGPASYSDRSRYILLRCYLFLAKFPLAMYRPTAIDATTSAVIKKYAAMGESVAAINLSSELRVAVVRALAISLAVASRLSFRFGSAGTSIPFRGAWSCALLSSEVMLHV